MLGTLCYPDRQFTRIQKVVPKCYVLPNCPNRSFYPITRIGLFTRLPGESPDYPNGALLPNARIQLFTRLPGLCHLPDCPNRALCPTLELFAEVSRKRVHLSLAAWPKPEICSHVSIWWIGGNVCSEASLQAPSQVDVGCRTNVRPWRRAK